MTESDARIAELEADNKRLRRLLEQDGASGELRHRLRNTLAMLRIIIRKSAGADQSLDNYVAHLEDRVDALARTQAAADVHGQIDLHGLIADELQIYAEREGERLILSGPAISLQPRTGQVFGLAVHELAVNAVEHGALGDKSGQVAISWSVADHRDGSSFRFMWKETGLTGLVQPAKDGFGIEVLTRTLRHELKAETNLTFDATGFSCVIEFPFSNSVGSLAEN